MMPFASECCKGSRLFVDLFLESYGRCTTHNGILKNCTVAIKASSVSSHVTHSRVFYSLSSDDLLSTSPTIERQDVVDPP